MNKVGEILLTIGQGGLLRGGGGGIKCENLLTMSHKLKGVEENTKVKGIFDRGV